MMEYIPWLIFIKTLEIHQKNDKFVKNDEFIKRIISSLKE